MAQGSFCHMESIVLTVTGMGCSSVVILKLFSMLSCCASGVILTCWSTWCVLSPEVADLVIAAG